MAEVTLIPAARPPAALEFEVLRRAADSGFDLAVAVVRGGSIVFYQERRNRHPFDRYTTVCSWERVYVNELEHQLRAARAHGYDVETVIRMVERKAKKSR